MNTQKHVIVASDHRLANIRRYAWSRARSSTLSTDVCCTDYRNECPHFDGRCLNWRDVKCSPHTTFKRSNDVHKAKIFLNEILQEKTRSCCDHMYRYEIESDYISIV